MLVGILSLSPWWLYLAHCVLPMLIKIPGGGGRACFPGWARGQAELGGFRISLVDRWLPACFISVSTPEKHLGPKAFVPYKWPGGWLKREAEPEMFVGRVETPQWGSLGYLPVWKKHCGGEQLSCFLVAEPIRIVMNIWTRCGKVPFQWWLQCTQMFVHACQIYKYIRCSASTLKTFSFIIMPATLSTHSSYLVKEK